MDKDVGRAFGVLVSQWSLLIRPCTYWDRVFAVQLLKDGFIINYMIVNTKTYGYESELYLLTCKTAEKGFNLDGNSEEKELKCDNRDKDIHVCNNFNETQGAKKSKTKFSNSSFK